MVAGSHLDQRGYVTAGSYGNFKIGNLNFKNIMHLLINAEAVILFLGIPLHQLDHDLDQLLIADGCHTEEIVNIEDSQSANFHVMFNNLGTHSVENIGGLLFNFNHIVCNQSVPPKDEIECAFAFADTAATDDEHTDGEDIDQHTM